MIQLKAGQKIFVIVYSVINNPEMKFNHRYPATIQELTPYGWHFVYDELPWSGYAKPEEESENGVFTSKDSCSFKIELR